MATVEEESFQNRCCEFHSEYCRTEVTAQHSKVPDRVCISNTSKYIWDGYNEYALKFAPRGTSTMFSSGELEEHSALSKVSYADPAEKEVVEGPRIFSEGGYRDDKPLSPSTSSILSREESADIVHTLPELTQKWSLAKTQGNPADHEEKVAISTSQTLPEMVEGQYSSELFATAVKNSHLKVLEESLVRQGALSLATQSSVSVNQSVRIEQIQRPVPKSPLYEVLAPVSTQESNELARRKVLSLQKKKKSLSIGILPRGLSYRHPTKNSEGYSYIALTTALENATQEGNLPLVASLLELGADANYISPSDRTEHNALQKAVESGHGLVVDHLLRCGATASVADTVLRAALKMDSLEMAMRLMPHTDFYRLTKVVLDSEDVYCSSAGAIIRWKHKDRLKLIRLLVNDPNFDVEKPTCAWVHHRKSFMSPGTCISTALGEFAYNGDLEGAKIFFERFEEEYQIPNRPNSVKGIQYVDPLCMLRSRDWQNNPTGILELARFLLKHGAQAAATVQFPRSTLRNSSPLVAAVMAGTLEGVELLLDNGADSECAMYHRHDLTDCFWSPLGYAAHHGKLEICRALVENDAIPWRVDANSETPLYHACYGGNLAVVNYLLSLDVVRSNIDKCLVAAVRKSYLGIAQALVDVGARVSDKAWITAMGMNVKPRDRARYFQIVDLLLSTGSKLSILAVKAAIDSKNLAGLSRVLEDGHNVPNFDKGTDEKSYLKQSCISYAQNRGANNFVALFSSYEWRWY